jgi:vacuolar protein sorting-associated protein 16
MTRYNHLSPAHLISRLTSRNLHLLALHVSSFLSLSPDNVLKHWASAKITKSKPVVSGDGKDADILGDEEISRVIVEKFEKLGGASVSYAEIAKKAWEVGRTHLATMVSYL